MAEDHQILGAGGPLGQCSIQLISNPENLGEVLIACPTLPRGAQRG